MSRFAHCFSHKVVIQVTMYLSILGKNSDDHPSRYKPSPLLLNFSDYMETGRATPHKQIKLGMETNQSPSGFLLLSLKEIYKTVYTLPLAFKQQLLKDEQTMMKSKVTHLTHTHPFNWKFWYYGIIWIYWFHSPLLLNASCWI